MAVALAVGGLGVLLLLFAADHFVKGAGHLAERLRIDRVVIGVVIIGIGTSAPELLVSSIAAGQGEMGIAVGNLVGSNVVNVTLILGASALVAPVVVRATVIRRESLLATTAVIIFALLTGLGLLPRREVGTMLAVVAVLALAVLVWLARSSPPQPLSGETTEFLHEEAEQSWAAATTATTTAANPDTSGLGVMVTEQHSLGRESLRTLLGLLGTLAGAQLLVVNASSIAERLGVAHAIVGATLVAVGTSMPELVTAVTAQRRGESDLVVGNLLGSNLFNALIGGAAIGLLAQPNGSGALGPASGIGVPLLVVMVAVMLLTMYFMRTKHRVSRLEGAVLLLAYLATLPVLLTVSG